MTTEKEDLGYAKVYGVFYPITRVGRKYGYFNKPRDTSEYRVDCSHSKEKEKDSMYQGYRPVYYTKQEMEAEVAAADATRVLTYALNDVREALSQLIRNCVAYEDKIDKLTARKSNQVANLTRLEVVAAIQQHNLLISHSYAELTRVSKLEGK